MNTKNAKASFDVHDVENVSYCFRVPQMKDAIDADFCGLNSELIYEYTMGGKTGYDIRFSISAMEGVNNLAFVDYCFSSSYLFGCAGVRSKQYCILNKQYTKEEYEKLVPKIIQHMNEMPYVDKKGRVYRYGEFFPPELSPFAYNETIAQEYFPLTKEQAITQGYCWRDPEPRQYEITIYPEELPDHIKDVKDDILNQIIACAHSQRQSASVCMLGAMHHCLQNHPSRTPILQKNEPALAASLPKLQALPKDKTEESS